jgi:hypothetical protein
MSGRYVAGSRTSRDRAAALLRMLDRHKRAAQASSARFVLSRSDRQLERAPVGPCFLAMLPLALRAQFRREYAIDERGRDIDATIVLEIERDAGKRRIGFEIVLAGQRCRIRRARGGVRADGTLKMSLADMIRMAAGAEETSALLSEGRVVASGDPFLLYRFPAMFRQPTRGYI